MKKLFAFVSIIMLAGTLAACSTDDTSAVEGTYLSVDINPSTEFIVDEEDVIVSYTALNEDGEIVLADLELEGLNVEEALDLYLEEATELGYIDVNADDNAVYISTSEDVETPEENDEATEEDTEEDGSLEDRVKNKINNHFASRGILGAAVGKDLHEEYGAIAEEYDIGLGKARLLSRAVELNEDLTFEEAVEMNMGEIMGILRVDHQERMETFRNERREEAQQFKNEMKNEMRDEVQAHRDEVNSASDNGEEGESMDFEAIEERIRNRSENDDASHRERMEDIKDRARSRMGGNGHFFGNDDDAEDDTNDDEDTTEE